MRKHISFLSIFMLCCVLFSCGNFFGPSEKSAITFELPTLPTWGGVATNSRSVTFSDGAYFLVTCKNVKSGRVVHNQKYSPADTVTINGIDAGSYEVTVSLFEKDDVVSQFRNSYVNASSVSASCTVKGGETTSLTLNMPYPEMCGWRMNPGEYPQPYYGIDNYGIFKEGNSFNFGIYNSTINENECQVTVTVEGESPVTESYAFEKHPEINITAIDFEDEGRYRTTQMIFDAVEGKKAFTIQVKVSDSEQYILSVPVQFADLCAEVDEFEQSESDQYYTSDSCFIAVGEDDTVLYLFKDNPRIAIFPCSYYEFPAGETSGGKKSAIDYVTLGASRYTELVYSQLTDPEDQMFVQLLGAYFDSVDDMKSSLGKALTADGVEISFHSSVNSEYNVSDSLSAETTAALASWLGVTIPGSNTQGGGETTLKIALTGTTPSEWEAWVLNSSGASVVTMNNSNASCKVPAGTYSIVMKGMQSSLVYVGAKKDVAVSGTEKTVEVKVVSFSLKNTQTGYSVAGSCYSQLSYNSLPTSASLSFTSGTTFQGWKSEGSGVTGLKDIPDTTDMNGVITFETDIIEPEPWRVHVTAANIADLEDSTVYLLNGTYTVKGSGQIGVDITIQDMTDAQYIVAFASAGGETKIALKSTRGMGFTSNTMNIDLEMLPLKAIDSRSNNELPFSFSDWTNDSRNGLPLSGKTVGGVSYNSWTVNGTEVAAFADFFNNSSLSSRLSTFTEITFSCSN